MTPGVYIDIYREREGGGARERDFSFCFNAHQGCIYLIKNTVKLSYCEILLQFKITNNCFLFYYILCDVKEEFSASLLQSSMSHDPSEINIICWCLLKNIYYHYKCWKLLCCLICGNFNVFKDSLMKRMYKTKYKSILIFLFYCYVWPI